MKVLNTELKSFFTEPLYGDFRNDEREEIPESRAKSRY